MTQLTIAYWAGNNRMDYNVIMFIGTGIAAGLIGSMVGLGGGIIVVPVLTLILGVDMKTAISASLISLIATSAMSVMVYAKKELIHYRLGLILCMATVLGSFSGSLLAVAMNDRILMIIFATLQITAVYVMIRNNFFKKQTGAETADDVTNISPEGFFNIAGVSYSEQSKTFIPFRVERIGAGFLISVFAGLLSGMLGVGGGILQVPTMNLVCKVPVKIATATSAYMIGFTGLAGALIFFLYGPINPVLTASLVIGILAGAFAGAHWGAKMKVRTLVILLCVVLILSAIRFYMKAVLP